MSMPYIHNDDDDAVIDSSEDSFTYVRFCSNKDGTDGSSRFRGKYMEVTVYSFKVSGRGPFSISHFHDLLRMGNINIARDLKEGVLDDCYDVNLDDIQIVSQKVVENPDYDPEYWQQEYEASLKAISDAEKQGYRIY